jgi:histidinol-phosphate aminotransferase
MSQEKVNAVIRADILALDAYHVADSSGMVKLDAMENPYGLPPAAKADVARIVEHVALNRYPDPGAARLKTRLHEALGVPRGMELLLGNGSDEIIQMLVLAVARPDAVVMGVDPAFVMFGMISKLCRVRYVGVPLAADFSLDLAAMLAAIEEHRPALIFIAYPNNPTGNLFDSASLERIIAAAPGIVVVDEAYHAFAESSFMPRLADFPNLLVMRTLSKLGLAGLRLGALAGRATWLEHVDKVRLPYNVGVLTQLVAETVLVHSEAFALQATAIRRDRARLCEELARIPGVRPYPSDANFVLFKTARASRVFERLRERGVLIKNLDAAHPLLADCLRVTVGTPEENEKFLAALQSSVETSFSRMS